jgi:hypothetical protein
VRAVTTRGCVSATEPIAAGELARLLAHDTRTPLNAVQGFAELLLGGAAGPLGADAVGYVAEIARAGRALEEAVALAQELAELDAPVAATDVQLPELLREVGFKLVAAGGTRLPAVRGTAERWRRVLHPCRDHLTGVSPPARRRRPSSAIARTPPLNWCYGAPTCNRCRRRACLANGCSRCCLAAWEPA